MVNKDIIFILPRLSGGGAERVTLNLLKELHYLSYSVGIIVFEKSGPLAAMLPNEVAIYDLKGRSLKRSIIPLIKSLHQLHPKVVFSTLGYINIALLAIRWALPKKISIWVREANMPSISLPSNPYPRLMIFLYRLLYKSADKVICTSEKMRDEFIFNFLVPKNIIKILPNPIDVDAIRSCSFPVKRFDKGGVCYVASGRLVYQKGFDQLLHWFDKLENKKSTLIILGEGGLKGELEYEAKLLKIQDRIRFLGFCDNPWQWYAGADAFLLSSRWEGMPNSALEALVCGTLVIATEESGGVKEIIGQGKSDNITVVSNEKQFIEAMDKVEIKDKSYKFDSLLPNRFIKKNVISTIERWLK
mgnify:FL=1